MWSSGARYHKVTTLKVRFFPSRNFRPNPKSASLTSPRSFKRMFAGFISLCNIFWLCKYSTPSKSCFMMHLISGREKLTLLAKSPAKSWSIYSRTKNVDPLIEFLLLGFESTIYRSPIIFVWFICLRSMISTAMLAIYIEARWRGSPQLGAWGHYFTTF